MASASVVRSDPYSPDDTRRGGGHHHHLRNSSHLVCKFWLAGRCNRNPCRFSHQSPPSPRGLDTFYGGPITTRNTTATTKRHYQPYTTKNNVYKLMDSDQLPKVVSPSFCPKDTAEYNSSSSSSSGVVNLEEDGIHSEQVNTKADAEIFDEDHVCAQWMSGTCSQAEKCRFPHSWVSSTAKTDIERIAQLQEHKDAVTGVVLPPGSHILFTGSRDGMLRAWDANTGKCIDYINVGAEVGCVICENNWLFAGVPNAIWAWNIETSQRLSLQGPVGQVHAMVVSRNTLFAACEDGDILAYKPCSEEATFRLTAKLKGHSKAVRSFAISEYHLYSGSEDCTIRCWDFDTFQCTHILEGHSKTVACLICWENYLFSGSLDKTFKVWTGTKDTGIEEILTYNEEQEVIAFMGMTDAAEKPVLFVSSKDNSVSMYELDFENTFADRGRLFTKNRVTKIAFSGSLVFTGDASGNVDVWKWLGQPCT